MQLLIFSSVAIETHLSLVEAKFSDLVLGSFC